MKKFYLLPVLSVFFLIFSCSVSPKLNLSSKDQVKKSVNFKTVEVPYNNTHFYHLRIPPKTLAKVSKPQIGWQIGPGNYTGIWQQISIPHHGYVYQAIVNGHLQPNTASIKAYIQWKNHGNESKIINLNDPVFQTYNEGEDTRIAGCNTYNPNNFTIDVELECYSG